MLLTHCITILNNLREGVIVTSPDRKILFWNQAAERITGFGKLNYSHNHLCRDVLNHADLNGCQLCDTNECVLDSVLKGKNSEAEIMLRHRLGFRIPISCRAFPLMDEKGTIVAAAQVFIDNRVVQEALSGMEEAQKMALLDPLTGLGNRGYAEIHLQRSLLELDRYGSGFAVFFIDVDKFKSVNDTFGHEVGDRVLQSVGSVLVSNLRASDVTARWGGEEFLVIALHIDAVQALILAEKLLRMVRDSFVATNRGKVRVTISIGATLAESEDTIETLVNRADELMYKSKIKGRDCITTDF